MPRRLTTLLFVALALPSPQESQQPVFRGRVETVAVPVTVFDPDQ